MLKNLKNKMFKNTQKERDASSIVVEENINPISDTVYRGISIIHKKNQTTYSPVNDLETLNNVWMYLHLDYVNCE